MEYDEYARLKEELLDAKEAQLRRQLKGAEGKFFDELFDKFLSKLEGDKTLSNTKGNTSQLARIDKLWEQFQKEEIIPIIGNMVKGYGEITKLNVAYLATIANKDRVVEAAEIVQKKVLERFGVEGNTLTKGGYLESYVTDTALRTEIKNITVKAILSPTKPRAEYYKEVRELIKGNKDLQGGFTKYFETFATDSFAQYDRSLNNQIAKRVGLQYAVYAGNLIKDSRPFCIARVDRVFTSKEIALFGTLKDSFGGYDKKPHFKGKPKSYDPFIDCGGHRCRHTLNFVSQSYAERLRKSE